MKYIKTHEEYSNRPKMGDYILTNKTLEHYDELVSEINDFTNNNIGQIVEILRNQENATYVVVYKNIPKKLLKSFNHIKNNEKDTQYENYRIINLSDIIYFSNKPFDVETAKTSNKYNL